MHSDKSDYYSSYTSIRDMGLFDDDFYLRNNGDVADSGVDPLAHFLELGAWDNRDPHPLFDVAYYLKANKKVARDKTNPVVHYIVQGWRKGCNPHPLFNTQYYISNYLAGKVVDINPLTDFIRDGWRQGRNPNEYFDVNYYLKKNSDVRESNENPLVDYISDGWRKFRDPSPRFCTAFYLASNSDIRDCNPLVHYLEIGRRQRRKPFPGYRFIDHILKKKKPVNTLFDAQYYLENNPDIKAAKVNPYKHFMAFGWKEGRSPCDAFDVEFYLSHYPDVKKSGENPLVQYIKRGTRQGRYTNPRRYSKAVILESKMFDSHFYLKSNPDVEKAGVDPLAHFVNSGAREARNPNSCFDVYFYQRFYSDVVSNGMNPLAHYYLVGKKERRFRSLKELMINVIDDSGLFDRDFYTSEYGKESGADEDALQNYVTTGWREGRIPFEGFCYEGKMISALFGKCPELFLYIVETVSKYQYLQNRLQLVNDSSEFEADMLSLYYEDSIPFKGKTDIKPIAFYQSSFQGGIEINEWTGEGDDDWVSCKIARNWLAGHFQTRKPHPDIGYYDLHDKNILRKQSRIASDHGIHGFCFYYYWFNGKRILANPLDLLFDDKSINLNYCLCWANDSWDGQRDRLGSDILTRSEYSPSEESAFIQEVSRYFRDSRYIRYEGKPILLVYRKQQIRNVKKVVGAWREWCRSNGIGEIYLIASQTYQDYSDPRNSGFDAAIEMPIHLKNPMYNVECSPTNPLSDFNGRVESYVGYVNSIAELRRENDRVTDYTLFRNVALKFDNAGKKGPNAHIFSNFDFDTFRSWVTDSIYYTSRDFIDGNQYFFINAWNEWSDGTHIEPDVDTGYTALNCISRALEGTSCLNSRKSMPTGFESDNLIFLDSPYERSDQVLAEIGMIAVHAHIVSIDWIDELLTYLANVPYRFTLLVTYSNDISKFTLESRIRNAGLAMAYQLILVEKKGWDIAPHLRAIGKDLLKYDLVCHLHSSIPLHEWRVYLMDRLLGRGCSRIIHEMFNDSELGICYPQTYPDFVAADHGCDSREFVNAKAKKTGIGRMGDGLHIPVTTFFWAKPKALEKFFNAGLTTSNFSPKPLSHDEKIACGVEAPFDIIVHNAGYKSAASALTRDIIQHPKKDMAGFNGYMKETYYENVSGIVGRLINEQRIDTLVFDLFDTLLIRSTFTPEDVFSFMLAGIEEKLGRPLTDFREARIAADGKARKRHNGKEINIDDIYDVIADEYGLSRDQAKLIQDLEVDTEISLMSLRENIYDILCLARNRGCRVVFATDMYLKRAHILKLLSKVGISNKDYNELYVSCEIGKRKDTGEMFDFLKEKGIQPAKTLVIGDNLHSDNRVPAGKGFRVFLLPKVKDLLLMRLLKSKLGTASFQAKNGTISYLGVVANRFYSKHMRRPGSLFEGNKENIGYFLIGPLVYEFAAYLLDVSKRDETNKLLFLTREGHFLKRIYDFVSEGVEGAPNSELLFSSRVMANQLHFVADENSIEDVIDSNSLFDGTIADFVYGRLGYKLTERDAASLSRNGFDAGALLSMRNDRGLIYKMMRHLYDAMTKTLAKSASSYLAYLRSQVSANAAVVDIGYSGSMQGIFESILNMDLKGYYMMAWKDKGTRNKSCLFDEHLLGAPKLKDAFWKYSIYYETLLTSTDLPMIGFKKNESSFQPLFDDIVKYDPDYLELLRLVQKGAYDFCVDVRKYFPNRPPRFIFESTLWGLKEFLQNPTYVEDIKLLAAMEMDDLYTGKMKHHFFDTNNSFLMNAKKRMEG